MIFLAPFLPQVGGGGVVTAAGLTPGQAVYWSLVSFDPGTQTEGAAWGSLRWSRSVVDKAGCAVNIYLAPTDPATVGKLDRVKASHA